MDKAQTAQRTGDGIKFAAGFDAPRVDEHGKRTTSNGYDPRWIDCINTVLEDRETGIQITDINENLWDEFIGPMIDAIEDDAQSPFSLPYATFAEGSDGFKKVEA